MDSEFFTGLFTFVIHLSMRKCLLRLSNSLGAYVSTDGVENESLTRLTLGQTIFGRFEARR